ncbi:MAG: hypothetical protein ACI37U_03620 [Bacteroides sp.]
MAVRTEEELAKQVQNGDDYIVIEGDLRNKVIKIKTKGKVAWAIAFGAIAVAIVVILTMPASAVTGPVVPVVEGVLASGVAAGAVAVLGFSTTVSAISMALAVKSKSVLTKLRNNYDIVEESKNRIVLRKK